MISTSCCWRGPPGAGKTTALRGALQQICSMIHQPFTIQRRLWDAPSYESTEDADEDAAAAGGAEKPTQGGLPMEISAVHWGFDIARMSLQDKQFIKAILLRWGRGNQVLSTDVPIRRCLVLYHAHLLSAESILLLQSFLELNHRDSMIWITSEQPVPPRLSDWFLELPVGGPDRTLATLSTKPSAVSTPTYSFEQDVRTLLKQWMVTVPVLQDVQKIRSLIYACLHRNIRWCEGFHVLLFALHDVGLKESVLEDAILICLRQPFTGPGQTVPSYRIPMLWENFFLQLRECLAPREPLSLPQKVPKKKKREVVKGNEAV